MGRRGIFENFTKYNVQVNRHNTAQQIRDAVLQSVQGVPGPVHIDSPRDLEEEDLPAPDERDQERLRQKDLRASTVRARPAPALVRRTVDLLREADRPLVIAGTEVRWFDASDSLERFVDAAEVPVATTKNSRGALSESNPFSLGAVGRPGLQPSNEYLSSADLVLAIGSRFSDVTTNNWELIDEDASLVHASLRAREFDRQYVADVNVFADVDSFLTELTNAVAGEGLSFQAPAAEARAAWEEARERFLDPSIEPAEEGVDPRKIVTEIDDLVEPVCLHHWGRSPYSLPPTDPR